MARVVVMKGRSAVGGIHQLKVILRDVRPVAWRRIHVPSTANLWELHNIIQVAMGWDNEHLHVFAKDWEEYGDNAKSEYDVTLARLLPDAGGWLAYRYDLGDCWALGLCHRSLSDSGNWAFGSALPPRVAAHLAGMPHRDIGISRTPRADARHRPGS
ncbi:hypothetical protein FHR32_004322 [Streptosporangium album]|uniref:Plasmid pRiA4b Orf3-like domain-containing protein n=1 Tax=Streptosporangium album TaxID=47479 RepID=A0A7W7WA28_9ACTN|nr:plasmid pRiA4b ORF-3 family protein [Streptosporangium album]MBB4940017.1 hypothetical protein [Streptosporangium album]